MSPLKDIVTLKEMQLLQDKGAGGKHVRKYTARSLLIRN